jgi:hypothetical protein
MAEMAPQLSPYRYGFNNPVNVTDPDGNFINLPMDFTQKNLKYK